MRDVARIFKAIHRGEKGSDPLVDLFLEEPVPEVCKKTLELARNDVHRIYLEAALLATEDTQRISNIFGFDKEVIELYEKVFFNVFGLSRLEKAWLVDTVTDQYEQNMKRWAFSQGIDFIAWRLGVRVDLAPVDGMASLYADCYFKAKEAFFNPNSAEASKEALKWTKQASELSRILKAWVSNNKEAMQDIELALKQVGSDDIDFGDDIKEISKMNTELMQTELDFGDIDEIQSENSKTGEK